jgi:hypothetical protein
VFVHASQSLAFTLRSRALALVRAALAFVCHLVAIVCDSIPGISGQISVVSDLISLVSQIFAARELSLTVREGLFALIVFVRPRIELTRGIGTVLSGHEAFYRCDNRQHSPTEP